MDNSPLDAFSEIGPTVTDTLVTALTKLSTIHEDLNNRFKKMSKKFEECNTALSNQLENVHKLQTESVQNQHSQPQRSAF